MNHPTTLIKDKTYVTYFPTYVFATGVRVNADSTPTYTVYKNGSASGDSVTITNIATGLYKLSFNPASEVEGDFFSIDISATVSAVAYAVPINFIVVPDVIAIQSGLATDTILTTALTEAYRSTGATGSAAQLLYEIIAHLGEMSIASTTKTLKKLDGSTTAKTYTLNDATNPTSITETT